MSKVTIAIPCWNQSQYLPEAIESALGQTYKNIEVIVVNDGSPDNTEEVAKNYPVKVINQVNKGLSSARNTALMNATGDYFIPLDADDILLPNAVEKLLCIAQESNADSVVPSIHCFGYAEQDVILMPYPKLDDFKEGNRLVYCQLFKTEVLKEIGGYSSRMDKGWEDLHLTYNLLLQGKNIVTTQEILLLYRTKKESMWTEARDKYGEQLWSQIIKDFPAVAGHKNR